MFLSKHPDYDPVTRQNDIALIKLGYDVAIDHEIQPACLPSKNFDLAVKNDSISVGFGITNQAYASRFAISNMVSDLFNDSMCLQVDPFRTKNWTRQFCAGITFLFICKVNMMVKIIFNLR